MTHAYFTRNNNRLHLWLYKSSVADEERLAYFKRKVLEALKASERRERRALIKSLLLMLKANYPVGTVRTWGKDKKVEYVKVAPGKWRPHYAGTTRGSKQTMTHLYKRVMACTDATQLMQIVNEHQSRFRKTVMGADGQLHATGELYDWVHDLHDFAREQRYKILTATNAEVEKRHEEARARREAEEKARAEAEAKAKAEAEARQKAEEQKKSSENTENFSDTGYIAGSQKEKVAWYFKMLRDNKQCADVNRIDWNELKKNPRLGKSLITKENVFGKPDWKALKDGGMDGNAGYLISRIYAVIAKEPQAQTEESQKNYVQALGSLRERLEKCKTKYDVFAEFKQIGDEYSGIYYTAEQAKALDNVVNEERYTLMKKFWEDNKNDSTRQGIRKVWQEIGDINKIHKSYSIAEIAMRKKGIDYWDWCTSLQEKTPTGEKKPRKKAFELLVADNYERKGGRDIKAVSTMDLKKDFNLRDVQVGSYVQSDAASAKWHIQNIAQGLADLSDVIGIPDDKISLNGRLALALGARGYGGALAHYEPVQRVINITKMKGGGSLAHEWFHAFDNLIASAESGNETLDGFVTEGQKIQNAKVQKAFSDVVTAMTQGNVPVKETVRYSAKDYRLARHEFAQFGSYANMNTRATLEKIVNAKNIDEAMGHLEGNPDFSNHTYYSKKDWQKMIVAHFDGNISGGSAKVYCGKTTSQYMVNAKNLDENRGKPYWSTIKEMGARAFAGFVEDKLASKGRKNDYLSNHANNSAYKNDSPYPAGAERERINNAFEMLFEVIKSENEIQKALFFDTFRR